MTDSRKKSIVEIGTGKMVSFTVGYFINLLILPLFGIPQDSHGVFVTVSGIFVGIATVRSYLWRRLFNRLGERFLR